MKVCRNLKEGLQVVAENQIFLRNSIFSNTDSRNFFYWLIECLNYPLTGFCMMAFNELRTAWTEFHKEASKKAKVSGTL